MLKSLSKSTLKILLFTNDILGNLVWLLKPNPGLKKRIRYKGYKDTALFDDRQCLLFVLAFLSDSIGSRMKM